MEQASYNRRSGSQSRIRFFDQQQDETEDSTERETQRLSKKELKSRHGYRTRKRSQEIGDGFQILKVASPPRTATQSGKQRGDRFYDDRKESKMDKALNFFRSRGDVHAALRDSIADGHDRERKSKGTGWALNRNFEAKLANPGEHSGHTEQQVSVENQTPNLRQVYTKKCCSAELGCTQEHTGVVNRCIFNRDSSLLLTVSGDCSCHIFRRVVDKFSDSWIKETSLRGHKVGTWGVAISSNDDFVFTAGGDGRVCFWLMGTRIPPMMDVTEIRKMLGRRGENSTGTHEQVFARLKAVMNIDEGASRFHEQYVRSERRWVCANTLTCESLSGDMESPAFDCSLHPSDTMIATAWGDGAIRIFRGAKDGTMQCDGPQGLVHVRWVWRCVQTMRDHAESAFACSFDPSGSNLATASKDGTVVLYSSGLSGFEKRRSLAGHMGPILGLSHHPCGRVMATASCDTNVVVWFRTELEGVGLTWVAIGTLFGHRGFVKACAFRADGQLLATASRDKTVRLWKMVSKPTQVSQLRQFKCLEVLRCAEELCSVRFASGAHMALLVAGSMAGRIFSWDTETCLKCSNPIETISADCLSTGDVKFGADAQGTDSILFKDEGHLVPPPPQSAGRHWSRIQPPNQTASKPAAVSESLEARQAVIYPDAYHSKDSYPRFQTMNPVGEQSVSIEPCKRIKDYTAESKTAKTILQLPKLEGSQSDMQKVMNIWKVLLLDMDMDQHIKLKRDALLPVIQHSTHLDTESIASLLTKIVLFVFDLLKHGKIHKRFPELKRYKNGNRWLLGKEELGELLGVSHTSNKTSEVSATQGSTQSPELAQGTGLVDSLEPAPLENERGGQLARELSTKTTVEAKRILGERIVKLIEPELTWTKDARNISGNIAARIVSTFHDNSEDSANFRNVCYLVFNLRRLYNQALSILKEINAAQHHVKDADLRIHVTGIGTLQHWCGQEGFPSSVENRCSAPLYSSTAPTTIGIVFNPQCDCKIVKFTTFLCLATTQTTREARDKDRRKALGLSFKFMVLHWDLQSKTAGSVIYLSEERMVTEHGFERFVLNCEYNPHTTVPGNQSVLVALTSSSCEAYCKGAAWVSGLKTNDKKRNLPDSPEPLNHGTFVFAGLPDGDPRNVWMRLDETVACEIEYINL